MQDKPRRTNAARSDAMRAQLIASARTLFVEKGYAETSTPEIVRHAGVTRGALYHHFADKAALFRAVLQAEYQAVAQEIDAAAKTDARTATQALINGSEGYLYAMRVPGRVRIMLLDGPAVLGRDVVEAIDRETSADALRTGLRVAMEAGEIRDLPLDALVAQLSAMFDRAALGVAAGEDVQAHQQVLDALITALAPSQA